MRIRTTFAAVCFTVLVALPASGGGATENLIPGGGFDTLSDYTTYWGPTTFNKFWVSFPDYLDSARSGSAKTVNFGDATNNGVGIFIGQCLPAEPFRTYTAEAWYFANIFQPATGSAKLEIFFQDQCGGNFLNSASEFNTNLGSWTLLTAQARAPGDAGGILVRLLNVKTSGTVENTWEVFFDGVNVPEPSGAAQAAAMVLGLGLLASRRRRLQSHPLSAPSPPSRPAQPAAAHPPSSAALSRLCARARAA